MTVRAKFKCVSKGSSEPESNASGTVTLSAVTDGSEENKEFFKFTPFGNITIGTVNDAAYQQFEPGKDYYVDFTLAE